MKHLISLNPTVMDKYDFNKTKYGTELLMDLIRLEELGKYIAKESSHCLSYYDITFITEGVGKLQLDEHACAITPGGAYFSSPGQARKWEVGDVPKGYALIFEKDFLSDFFNDMGYISNLSYFNSGDTEPVLFLRGDQFSFFLEKLELMEREMILENGKGGHVLRALLYYSLAWLDRVYLQSKAAIVPSQGKHAVDFAKLVNEFFVAARGVGFYADKLNISPDYLNDIAKRNFGVSAKQYILNRVFLEAKRLLLHSSMSVSEVAGHLQFQDVSYFIRAFKNQTGSTPQAYKASKSP